MKKVLGLAAVAVLFFATSCKKDHTCECVTTVAGIEADRTEVTAKYTKSDAEEWCDKGDSESTILNSKTECSIK